MAKKIIIRWNGQDVPEVLYDHNHSMNVSGTALIVWPKGNVRTRPGELPKRERIIPLSSLKEYEVQNP
jgi:hypothetical protein